jgi:hypothetical protein
MSFLEISVAGRVMIIAIPRHLGIGWNLKSFVRQRYVTVLWRTEAASLFMP